MPRPHVTPLSYTYKKPDTDVWVLNTDDIPVDHTLIKDSQIAHLGPQSSAGNHKHPRQEWIVGFGDLVFIWLDEAGTRQEQHMNPDGQLFLIHVPAFVPHAVLNRSLDKPGMLFEYADAKAGDVEKVEIISV